MKKQTGFSLLVLAPFEVKDHRGVSYNPVDRAVGRDSHMIILSNCPEIFKAGDATLSLIEEKVLKANLGFGKDFLEKLDGAIVFMHNNALGILDPLARHFPDDQIFWSLCGHMVDEAKLIRAKLNFFGHESPRIIRRRSCTDPRRTGEMLRNFSFKEGKEIILQGQDRPLERLVKAEDDLVKIK